MESGFFTGYPAMFRDEHAKYFLEKQGRILICVAALSSTGKFIFS
jgi:hypothetical protein